ncbi:MAG: AAA family ATPase [Gemmatimonadota bacterium]
MSTMTLGEPPPEAGPTVELFGGPKVVARDEPIDLTSQQQVFITLVFGHGDQGISRPRLGWILWEEDESPRLRQRIRQLLHRTHERLGAPLVEAEGDHLRPLSTGVACDLRRFEALLRRGSLAEAAGMLSHGLASRLTGTQGDSFEDWLLSKRAGLFEDLRKAASRRWDETSEAGLWGEARDAAEALYMHFPEDVGVVTRVIESRARTGSLASAEAVLARLRQSGVSPDTAESLDELMLRVQRLRSTPPSTSPDSDPRVPLVGRRGEIAQAVEGFGSIEDASFRFVLITGEGGIGKTRVLDEVRKEAVLSGYRCLSARPAEPEHRIPLNPLADAFSEIDLAGHLRALGAPWRSVIGTLLPIDDDEPIEQVPPIQEAHLSRRLMDALYLLLQRVAAEEPTLLFLDDLQWADATTVTALQFVQRRWTGGAFGVVAAIRPDLIDPFDPVTKYLLSAEHLPITRIDLKELSPDDGRRLVDLVLGQDVDQRVNERLCELGGLHPLYVTEIAKDFRAGRLKLPELPVDEVAIPVSLQEILRRRVGLLSPIATKVAGLLAVRARAMRLTEIADLTGLPLGHCADCAEELKQLRLAEMAGNTVRVAHELFRSALYQHLSDARRTVLHRSIAEHLASLDDAVPEGEMAMHYARAGERAPAVRYGWSAATSAIESGAVAEAAYFFDLVVRNEDDPVKKAVATAELGRALHLGRAIERANPILELASVRLREIGDPNRALRMDIRRVEGLAEADAAPATELLGRLDAIKREAQELGDWEALALGLDVELRFAHYAGDVTRARKILSHLEGVRDRDCRSATIAANCSLSIGILFGKTEAAREAAEAALQQSKTGDQGYRLRAINRAIIVFYHQGLMRGEGSQAILREARQLARNHGDLVERFSLESNAAAELMDAGYFDEADAAYTKAEELLMKGEMTFSRINLACNRGELALARGQYHAARELFSRADGHLGGSVPSYTKDFVNAGVGLAALEVGDLGEAREREQRLGSLVTSDLYYDPTTILQFRSRYLERKGDADAAMELLDLVAKDLESRLVLAWLKTRLLQVRLLLRRGEKRPARDLAEEARSVAVRLGMEPRVREIERLARLSAVGGR